MINRQINETGISALGALWKEKRVDWVPGKSL